jgi:hypothetical protein
VAFTQGPQAHYETRLTCAQAALVGVGDDGGVEQGRRLGRHFPGEIGADEQRPVGGYVIAFPKAAGSVAEMAFPRGLELPVAMGEAPRQVCERGRDVGVVHGQDSFGDRDGA